MLTMIPRRKPDLDDYLSGGRPIGSWRPVKVLLLLIRFSPCLVQDTRLLIGALLATGLSLNGFMAWKDRDLVRKGYPDFTIFYSAGKMVRAGMASSLYDESVEFQTQVQFAPGVSIRHGALPYNHPPFEALLFVPFSFLAYLPAYLAWNAVNLGLLCMALRILRPHVRVIADQVPVGLVFMRGRIFPDICLSTARSGHAPVLFSPGGSLRVA